MVHLHENTHLFYGRPLQFCKANGDAEYEICRCAEESGRARARPLGTARSGLHQMVKSGGPRPEKSALRAEAAREGGGLLRAFTKKGSAVRAEKGVKWFRFSYCRFRKERKTSRRSHFSPRRHIYCFTKFTHFTKRNHSARRHTYDARIVIVISRRGFFHVWGATYIYNILYWVLCISFPCLHLHLHLCEPVGSARAGPRSNARARRARWWCGH